MTLTTDQHKRARDLFEAALDRDPAELLAWLSRNPDEVVRWLEAEAPDDPQVRAEVQSLLAHHTRAGSFLNQPVAEAVPQLLEEDEILQPGDQLGHYSIVKEIGRGGMGRVYLARDSKLARVVALKALAPQLVRQGHRDRLKKEAQAAAMLTHPGICTVYALEELDGELYIATEYVEGQTLREEIGAQERPARDKVLRTTRELASALAAAHARGIVHRDLKPENVMRTRDGGVKILDFGLARMTIPGILPDGTVTLTGPGALAGTPLYMAPEQFKGETTGPYTDVFAFGVLIYEWSSGTHPFKANSLMAVSAEVLKAQPDSVQHLPNLLRFWPVLERCLQKDPSKRYDSGAELLRAIEEVPVRIEPGVQSPSTTLWWRTHQLTMMLLYVVAVTLAWYVKSRHDPNPHLLALWIFVLMGAFAATVGIIRGHLVFSDIKNPAHLPDALTRTERARVVLDLLLAALLIIDAFMLVATERQPLQAVLTCALAIGIALATILMEPATTKAVFKHSSEH